MAAQTSAGGVLLRQRRDPAATQLAVSRLRRRSLVIHFLRGALPALIVLALVGLLGWAGYRTLAELSPAEKPGGDIRMLDPEFHGRDKAGRPYVVTAQSAVRDPQHIERSTLVEPRIVMQTAERGDVKVSAQHGLYDQQTRILNLWGAVTVDDAQGNHMTSPTARVDTDNHTATGRDGVAASGPLGAVTASSYAIDDKAGHVLLTGNVHTHLITHGSKK